MQRRADVCKWGTVVQDRDSAQRFGEAFGSEASPASQPQPPPGAHQQQQQPRQKRRLLLEADDACSVPDMPGMGPGARIGCHLLRCTPWRAFEIAIVDDSTAVRCSSHIPSAAMHMIHARRGNWDKVQGPRWTRGLRASTRG